MSEKDLVKELKAEIVEITKDRDDALAKVKSKESRMKLAPEGRLADELAQNSGVSDLQPSAAMERQEAATGLMSQISKLPDRQQEVLRLKFNAGLSYKEIAEVTGLTSSNVGFILHTAIAKLRQRLVPAS